MTGEAQEKFELDHSWEWKCYYLTENKTSFCRLLFSLGTGETVIRLHFFRAVFSLRKYPVSILRGFSNQNFEKKKALCPPWRELSWETRDQICCPPLWRGVRFREYVLRESWLYTTSTPISSPGPQPHTCIKSFYEPKWNLGKLNSRWLLVSGLLMAKSLTLILRVFVEMCEAQTCVSSYTSNTVMLGPVLGRVKKLL